MTPYPGLVVCVTQHEHDPKTMDGGGDGGKRDLGGWSLKHGKDIFSN